MSDKSAIEWTDATWNPTTGCTKVSPACANCYIERTIPFRVRGRRFIKGDIPIELHENRLDAPLKKGTPTMYFVNSLSDLFHPDVPNDFLHRVYHTMEHAAWHTFQVLTKRPERMREYLNWRYGPDAETPRGRIPSRHIWHGVSAENQHWFDVRVPILRDTRTRVRFLSIEPMLGPIDARCDTEVGVLNQLQRYEDTPGIDWVIVGAESGPRVRPTNPAWVRSLRDQCVAAGVPFFFKQWGGRTAKSGGRMLDGRTWDEMPPLQAHGGNCALVL
jgi:protein gp37